MATSAPFFFKFVNLTLNMALFLNWRFFKPNLHIRHFFKMAASAPFLNFLNLTLNMALFLNFVNLTSELALK